MEEIQRGADGGVTPSWAHRMQPCEPEPWAEMATAKDDDCHEDDCGKKLPVAIVAQANLVQGFKLDGLKAHCLVK